MPYEPPVIHPPSQSLADSLWLSDTPSHALLALVRNGVLSLEDAWEVVDPKQTGVWRERWGRPTPRVLLWLFHSQAKEVANSAPPTDEGWAVAEDPARADDPAVSSKNRLLAWAFSASEAWKPGPWDSHIHLQWPTAVDWAIGNAMEWAVDAALRQPRYQWGELGAGWFEQHLAQMVWRGNVGTARVLLAHANIDLDSLRVELRGPQHMESIHCVEGPGLPLMHLANSVDMIDLLIEHGANPLAVDPHQRTADQYWRARVKRTVEDSRYLAAPEAAVLIGRLLDRTTSQEGELAQQAIVRQGRDIFLGPDSSGFRRWLAHQPKDLTVGLDAQLPGEALMGVSQWRERTNRAAELMGHLTDEAMARVGGDGLVDREALWWVVFSAGLKKHDRLLASHQTGVEWKKRLDDLELIMAREPSMSSGMSLPGLTTAGLEMMGRWMEAVNQRNPRVLRRFDPSLEALLTQKPGQPTLIEQLAIRLAMGGRAHQFADLEEENQPYNVILKKLALEATTNPLDSLGHPRHHLLDAMMLLAGRNASTSRLKSEEVRRAVAGEHDPAGFDSPAAALIEASHVLISHGARPSPQTVGTLTEDDVLEARQLGMWLQQVRLNQVMEPAQPQAQRPSHRL